MDNEKKYNELVGKIKRAYLCAQTDSTKAVLEDILPELRESESEDDKIRKALIRFHKSTIDIDGIKGENILTWLEKQKEFVSVDFDDVWKTADCDELTAPLEKYSKDAIKEMCHAWYDKGIELERKRCLEKQGEQKLTNSYCQEHCKGFQETGKCFADGDCKAKTIAETIDKVEPEFREGDWIVQENIGTYKVIEVCEAWYEVIDVEDNHYSIAFDKEYMCHFWTIQDAKPGDVLASKDELSILIFRNLDTSTIFSSYYNIQRKGELGWSNECFIPATKEQRDLLFRKMKEEGYEWNANKKELKKIEQIPAWSEEDEMFVHGLIRGLAAKRDIHGHTTFSSDCIDITEAINWLKSLKERCTWKPSDEQIVALEHFVRSIGESGFVSPYDNNTKLLYTLLNGLKKLKG